MVAKGYRRDASLLQGLRSVNTLHRARSAKAQKSADYYLNAVNGTCNSVKPFKHLNQWQVKSLSDGDRNMPENSEVALAEPPAALYQQLLRYEQAANSIKADLKSDPMQADLSDRPFDAIELLEAHGFTVFVR